MTVAQSHVVRAYLSVLPDVVTLLHSDELARRWDSPSALEQMSVAALAEHLGSQITQVPQLLAPPWRSAHTTSLDDYYRTAAWIGTGVDADANRHIRQEAEVGSGEGREALIARVEQAVVAADRALSTRPEDATVAARGGLVALSLDDYLRTRLMEIAVHSDDLAVSLGVATPELGVDAQGIVIAVLGRISIGRHGWVDVLRGLARTERAPASGINAL